ncbi:MAG: DUF983 domain-containing protein [Bacteroidia bacterium]
MDNLYENNNPYYLPKLGRMKKNCACCGQKFEPETGFYYGAMYVSYGLSVVLMAIAFGILYWGFDASFPVLLSTILGIYILGFPLLFRISRNIWLSMFVKYNATLRAKLEQQIV